MFYIGIIGTLAIATNTVRAWRATARGWAARFVETSALVAAVAFAWIPFDWNLLRPDLRF